MRLNDLARRRPALAERQLARSKEHGFEWALDRLRAPSPSLLLRPSVRAVSLFEIWTHHEDVRRPNGVTRASDPDLGPVIPFLLRYGHLDLRVVADDGRTWGTGTTVVTGALPELVLWLTGRAADVSCTDEPPTRFI